jgi:hypothetical protein
MILPPRPGANANGPRIDAPAAGTVPPVQTGRAARRDELPPIAAVGSRPDPHRQQNLT